MRLALLTSAKGWRGSAASYAKLARGLAERGHQMQLITTAARLTARYAAEHLPVREIPGQNTGAREVWALWRTLRQSGAQAVVVDTPRDLRLSTLASLLHPAKVVYRYNLNYRRARNDLADRLYARRVTACVFQSHFIQEEASRQAPWVARVPGFRIPNGYDTERYRASTVQAAEFRRKWDIPGGSAMVLTSAKLARNKGHDVAIRALDRVRRGGIGLVYVICGDGVRESELRALASACQLPARFTGLLDTEELIGGLSAADLVVHPSPQEIFPNAVGEAMSCERAVIAADAGGTAELLGRDGSSGLLVQADDPERLAAAVTALLKDPFHRARLGAAARARIQTEFPLSRMIDGYEAALEQVVGAAR
jgi:glycosyltransferase involved in cell wall biosynthesis